MRKIIFAQVLTTNGTTVFSGLFDENENPVSVETECDDSGVTLTIWRNAPETERRDCGISEEEIERTCSMYDDCNECPLWDYCNEDVGQMSAWYVLAASGIHPSCPGNTRMEITSPVFDKVEFNLDPSYYTGKKFTVIAHNNSINNVYIQKALLNGQEYNKCYLDFADIVAGGTLELFMGDKPNVEWGL